MVRKLMLILFFVPCLLFGKDLTLKQAIDIAMKNNPQIKALEENYKASSYGESAAKTLKYGELDLNAGFKKLSDDGLIRPMSKDLILSGLGNMPFDNEYWYWNLDYKLPIYSGGKIKTTEKIAQERKNSVFYKLKAYKWELRYQVTKVYLSILSVDKRLDSLEKYLESLKSLKSHIDEGVRLGKFAEVDEYKVNFQIELAKSNIETLKQLRSSLLNSLANLLGEKDLSNYKLESDVDSTPAIPDLTLSSLVEKAYSNRGDLLNAKSFVKIKKLSVNLAKADWKPKVSLNATLMAVNGNNIDYSDKFWTVTANVSLPLFDMGRRYKKIKQTRREEKSALNFFEGVKLNVKKEVSDAYTKLQKEFQNYKTAVASLKFQKEVERIERLKYKNGKGDIDDLLFAEARKQMAEASVIKAKYNFFIAKEELKKSIEGELK